MHDVTRILSAIELGDPHAAEQLLPLIYEELRQQAAQKLVQEKPGQTLQATALVHEAYLRLVNPAHCFGGGSEEVYGTMPPLLMGLLAAGPGWRPLQIEPVHNTASIGRKNEFCRVARLFAANSVHRDTQRPKDRTRK
jgi:hypothetical protein